MGLRYRRSISICPGIRLNFSNSGMSISGGVPGFRKTISTSGRVTTTVGLPGTGLYYTDSRRIGGTSSSSGRVRTGSLPINNHTDNHITNRTVGRVAVNASENSYQSAPRNLVNISEIVNTTVNQVDVNMIKSIHKSCDDSIDWTEVLVSELPPDETYNKDMWKYYHSLAPKVLAGDIDTYLQLIYEVNPLDDLLFYGKNFEFGTDDSRKIEVEFTVNEATLSDLHNKCTVTEYNDLFQDFVCSTAIRIARDMFALLPVSNTIVHSVFDDSLILSVNFDRKTLSSIKFGYIDPSDTMAKFKCNMDFDINTGFFEVERV